MIFYTALDERGHKQLRATQADAKAVNRAFEKIDIPTEKAGLMAFVQQLYAHIDTLQDQIVEGGEGLPEPPTGGGGGVEPIQPLYSSPQPPLPPAEPPADDEFQPNLLETQVEALGALGPKALEQFDSWSKIVGIGANFSRGVHLLNVFATGHHEIARNYHRQQRKFG